MKKRCLAFILTLCMALSSVPALALKTDTVSNESSEAAEQQAAVPSITLSELASAYVGQEFTMKAVVSGLSHAETGVKVVWTVNKKTVQSNSAQTIKNGDVLKMTCELPSSTKTANNTVTVTLKKGAQTLASASTTVDTLFGFDGAELTASGKEDVTVGKKNVISMKLTGLKADVEGTYQWYVDGKAVSKAKGKKTFENKQTFTYNYKAKETGKHNIKLVLKSADKKVTLTSPEKEVHAHKKFAKTLGTYTTYFTTSNYNRCVNMRLVAKAINGKIVRPGRTFSLNGKTGRRNASKGYRRSIVFRGRRQLYGYGGGTCQVVSTLFNAALLANMTITERHNHPQAVSYIAKGRDAGVGNTMDFKFKNNLDVPVIVMATYNSRGSITVKIKADYEADNQKPTIRVTRSRGLYILRRYVNGKVNYTTTSRH